MRRLRMSPYALALCAATAAFAQPGFEGTWALQVGRSSALPPGMEQRMTIAREGDGLRVKTAIVTDFADREQDDLYVFDGAPHDAQSPGAGSGKRIATRQAERAFSAVDTLQGPNGETTISRTWELADDGGELTIDLTVASAFSGRTCWPCRRSSSSAVVRPSSRTERTIPPPPGRMDAPCWAPS